MLIPNSLLSLILLLSLLSTTPSFPVGPDFVLHHILPLLAQETPTPVYGYRVLAVYPHDPNAFTQGLIYYQGNLYESTGLYGRSSIRYVDLETGQILQQQALASSYFGEGLALYNDRLYQLTWQAHTGFMYDRATLQPTGTFTYTTEGWGLTYDGQWLIMSDGTPNLYFRDPDTFQLHHTITVHDETGPVWNLNELEYIQGQVFANVWQTDRIARIDPSTGRVTAWIDLQGLLPPEDQANAHVLNGIAWDETGQRLFVTGKLWPKLFQIQLVPPTYHLYLGRIEQRAPHP